MFAKQKCRDPGSNRGPLDLQSNALPTELSRQDIKRSEKRCSGSQCALKYVESYMK